MLIRRDIRTWPLGILYVLISLFLFAVQRLYFSFGLHLLFLLIYSYGWWRWAHGSSETSKGRQSWGEEKGGRGEEREEQGQEEKLPVTHSSPWTLAVLLLAGGIAVWASMQLVPASANLPFGDSLIAALSVIASWLTARKRIESWPLWLLADLIATGVYSFQGLYFYASLYAVYMLMAVNGWRSWQRALSSAPSSPAVS